MYYNTHFKPHFKYVIHLLYEAENKQQDIIQQPNTYVWCICTKTNHFRKRSNSIVYCVYTSLNVYAYYALSIEDIWSWITPLLPFLQCPGELAISLKHGHEHQEWFTWFMRPDLTYSSKHDLFLHSLRTKAQRSCYSPWNILTTHAPAPTVLRAHLPKLLWLKKLQREKMQRFVYTPHAGLGNLLWKK